MGGLGGLTKYWLILPALQAGLPSPEAKSLFYCFPNGKKQLGIQAQNLLLSIICQSGKELGLPRPIIVGIQLCLPRPIIVGIQLGPSSPFWPQPVVPFSPFIPPDGTFNASPSGRNQADLPFSPTGFKPSWSGRNEAGVPFMYNTSNPMSPCKPSMSYEHDAGGPSGISSYPMSGSDGGKRTREEQPRTSARKAHRRQAAGSPPVENLDLEVLHGILVVTADKFNLHRTVVHRALDIIKSEPPLLHWFANLGEEYQEILQLNMRISIIKVSFWPLTGVHRCSSVVNYSESNK